MCITHILWEIYRDSVIMKVLLRETAFIGFVMLYLTEEKWTNPWQIDIVDFQINVYVCKYTLQIYIAFR